jgi:hypothetical protein
VIRRQLLALAIRRRRTVSRAARRAAHRRRKVLKTGSGQSADRRQQFLAEQRDLVILNNVRHKRAHDLPQAATCSSLVRATALDLVVSCSPGEALGCGATLHPAIPVAEGPASAMARGHPHDQVSARPRPKSGELVITGEHPNSTRPPHRSARAL